MNIEVQQIEITTCTWCSDARKGNKILRDRGLASTLQQRH